MAKEKEKQKEEEQQEESKEAEAKPKGKKKLFIIIGAVVLVLCIGLPIAFLGGGKKAAKSKDGGEEQVDAQKSYATFDMDTIIVNLSEIGTFLKVTITIEYDPVLLPGSMGPVAAAMVVEQAAEKVEKKPAEHRPFLPRKSL
jgi:hypothetical protein